MLKLGYAEVDITPYSPIETIGFNRGDNISQGVLKPLLAQIAVWNDEDTYCLITIDSIGFKQVLTDNLRNRVCNVLNTSFEKVMICFSHCHSAPNADAIPEYYEMVCERIEAAAKDAAEKWQEVSIGWGNASVDIGVNRRKGSNKLDNRVGILKVCRHRNSAMELLVLRLTAHCNALKRDNYMISPDFFGAIREALNERYNCPVMIVQGAAGNIAPKYFKSKGTPIDASGEQYIRSETALEDMAQVVLEAAAPIITNIEMEEFNGMQMYSRNTVLYAQVPTYETAQGIAKEAKENCGIDGTQWLKEVQKLNNSGIKVQEESVEVQYLKIGKGCLCGVPYELMVEFALGSQEKLNDEFFYLNGYTNGCSSYFPTEEEFDLGGYEVYWSLLLYYSYFNRVFPLMRESATMLIDFVVNNAPEGR